MQKVFPTFFLFSFVLSLLIAPASYAAQLASDSSAHIATSEASTRVDNRVTILKKYLEEKSSPLAPYALRFVTEADKNNIDWRLLVSISGVESTFAQQLPQNSYNAWGWGIYGNNTFKFSSYDEAITTISLALRDTYMNKWGAKDIYEIGRLYAASPTWADRVTYFMENIDKFKLDNPENTLSISL